MTGTAAFNGGSQNALLPQHCCLRDKSVHNHYLSTAVSTYAKNTLLAALTTPAREKGMKPLG